MASQSEFGREEGLRTAIVERLGHRSGFSAETIAADASVLLRFPFERGRVDAGGREALLLRWAEERARGVPLAHVIGASLFLGRWFALNSSVLAPHPATALLTCLCLQRLRNEQGACLGLETGFGTGVISLSLAARRPGLRMVASELSPSATAFARANAEALLGAAASRFVPLLARCEREVVQPFVRAGVGGADFIVSNPPYLAVEDEISDEYRLHMPATALYGPDGEPLHHYREIARNLSWLLGPRGHVFLECRASRADAVAALFARQRCAIEILDRDEIVRTADPADLAQLSQRDRERRYANHRFVVATVG